MMEFIRHDRAPLRSLSPEDQERAEDILFKMYMAHELAMAPQIDGGNFDCVQFFQLKDPLFNMIETSMNDAFWDKFRAELEAVPPRLIFAINMLKQLKDGLNAVIARSTRLRAEMEEVLDIEMLEQQAEHGVFDVKYYGNYIISIMKKMCAPVRDRRLDLLTTESDPTQLLRGLFEVLALMKRDIISFNLSAIAPQVQINRFEFERSKFTEYFNVVRALPKTDEWLEKHIEDGLTDDDVLFNAYLSFINLRMGDIIVPETLVADVERLKTIRHHFYWVTAACSLTLACISCCPASINCNKEFKENTKTLFENILKSAKTERALFKATYSITLLMVRKTNALLVSMNQPLLTVDQVTAIRRQIEAVCKFDHNIRKLIRTRTIDHLKKVLENPNDVVPVPPALTSFKDQVDSFAHKFKIIIHHNLTICKQHYISRIQELRSNA